MKRHLKAIFNSYSEIFFLRQMWIGVLLFAATLFNPNLALSGIISAMAAYLFARFINMGKDYLDLGFYTYNPLLVGLSIGYLFRISPLTIFLLIIAGIATFILTAMMFNIFWTYFKLPVLSLPFALMSSAIYLGASQFSNLYVSNLYPQVYDSLNLTLPLWLSGFFRSLGTIFFMPHVLPGIILAIILLGSSRILFMLAVAGYYCGTVVTALMVGSFDQAFSQIYHFNYILIAMSVGSIFLIPSIKSYFLALLAVCTSTILLESVIVFWSYYGIPGFTIPFNIISLSFVYVLGLVNFPLLVRVVKVTPEETLDHYLSTLRRYPGTYRTLSLPFAGKWTVWQAFDGDWTHQGHWRYAYDFIITDDDGQSYRNGGEQAGDYYAYRKPVLSPVRGRVTKVISGLADNPIGQVDKANNWGNLVIIYDERGFFVEISHFAQNSIDVAEGDWVERGSYLGLCGNSGYSPQPHIHIQVQGTGEIGSYTLPFSFVNYVIADPDGASEQKRFYANDLPPEKTQVEPMHKEKSLEIKTSFMLDDHFVFETFKAGQQTGRLELVVRMAPDGTFYFDTGASQLYFGLFEDTFYFYRMDGEDEYLKAFFLALPRLPLACKPGIIWTDYLPLGLVTRGLRKGFLQFVSSFHHNAVTVESRLECGESSLILSTIRSAGLNLTVSTRMELDEEIGFRRIQAGTIELKRVPNEAVRH